MCFSKKKNTIVILAGVVEMGMIQDIAILLMENKDRSGYVDYLRFTSNRTILFDIKLGDIVDIDYKKYFTGPSALIIKTHKPYPMLDRLCIPRKYFNARRLDEFILAVREAKGLRNPRMR